MYKIYADDLLIYDDTSSDPYVKVTSPKLSLAENSAGSLTMTVPPGNVGYDTIVRMATDITVTKNDEYYWAGRVLQEKKDFWNNRNLTCEGELAFFNDTSQPQKEYSFERGVAIRRFLESILEIHNQNALPNRQFVLGTVGNFTVPSGAEFVTNYEKTIEYINKLATEYGGRFQVRRQNGIRYLDFLNTELNMNSQTVEFAKNLIELSSSFDSSEFATVLVPLGAKLEFEKVEGLENYLTVESSTKGDGSRYVRAAEEVINSYGWIEKVVHFEDITSSDELYDKAVQYLTDIQFDTMVIDISAFDLHYLNPKIEDIKIGDKIRVISAPHGINRDFPLKKLDIPMDQPQNATYQLGDSVKVSMTAANNKTNAEILERLSKTPDINEDAILKAAQDNAAALMDQHLNGYVTLTTDEHGSNELYVSEGRPLFNEDGSYAYNRFWRWNMNGLGYTDDGGVTWKNAMLMDGSILGERIAAGSIHGSKITAGTLELTTGTGETGLSLGLSARGLYPGSFTIGWIDPTNGKDSPSTAYGRTRLKTYLTKGSVVTFSSDVYTGFEVFQYSDNESAESGYVKDYGGLFTDEFTVVEDGYYRFVVPGVEGSVSTSDLDPMAASFGFSGTKAVIKAEDLQVIGMVTLTSLSNPQSSTFIDGGNIKTGTIDLRGITVTTGTAPNEKVTFQIDTDGNVTVNGTVNLTDDSVITFDGGTTKTIGDLDDATKALANGTYDENEDEAGAFITKKVIYGPTIIGNELVAVTKDKASDTSGRFVLGVHSNESGKLYDERFSIEFFNNSFYNSIKYCTYDVKDAYGTVQKVAYHDFDRTVKAPSFEDTGAGTNLIYNETDFRGILRMAGTGANIVLLYGTNYVSNVASLPDAANCEVGQICFVLN